MGDPVNKSDPNGHACLDTDKKVSKTECTAKLKEAEKANSELGSLALQAAEDAEWLAAGGLFFASEIGGRMTLALQMANGDKPFDPLVLAMGIKAAVVESAVVTVTKAATTPKLPTELAVGRNADADIAAYYGIKNGAPTYCGISCDLPRRFSEHLGRFDELRSISQAPLTRGEARAIEQALILRNPNFSNQINSISPRHAWYSDAVAWGEWWLKANGK